MSKFKVGDRVVISKPMMLKEQGHLRGTVVTVLDVSAICYKVDLQGVNAYWLERELSPYIDEEILYEEILYE